MAKPGRKSGSNEGDLWNDDDEWYLEDDDVDEDTDDDELDDDDEETDDEDEDDDLDPALTKRLAKEREALYAQIVKEIAEGNTDSEIHKGLQRHISARDKTIAEQNKALAALTTELQAIKSQMEGVNEGVAWTGQKLIEALEPEAQEKLKVELSDRLRNQELEGLKREMKTFQDAARQNVNTDPQAAALQQAAERRKAFVEQQQKLAKEMGVDPSKLDYGTDEDGVVEMQEKFQKSLMKAIKSKSDKELESVTRKREAPATRGSGGSSAGWSGMSAAELLERGAAQRLPRTAKRKRGR